MSHPPNHGEPVSPAQFGVARIRIHRSGKPGEPAQAGDRQPFDSISEWLPIVV
jgi:hypothetical protein